HVIGSNGDMGRALLDHTLQGVEDAARGGNLAPLVVSRGRQSVIVPEQLVGAVYQMNLQGKLQNKL
ncbi:MAG: hypothetical protein ABIZ80_04655, partial [Bryobacteraceae bacterium]